MAYLHGKAFFRYMCDFDTDKQLLEWIVGSINYIALGRHNLGEAKMKWEARQVKIQQDVVIEYLRTERGIDLDDYK